MGGSGDIGMVLVAVIVIGGGIYLLQSGALGGLGLGSQAPPEEDVPQDSTTDLEEQGAAMEEEPAPEQDVAFPIPVYIPVPGLSRREICRRQPPFGFGGSCNSECRNFGMNSSICRTCISYCGRPSFVDTAPRPRTTNFPRTGHECPRGQRYNWSSRKCEDVQSKPTNRPTCPSNKKWNSRTRKCEDVMTTQQQPAAPAESAFTFSYRGVY